MFRPFTALASVTTIIIALGAGGCASQPQPFTRGPLPSSYPDYIDGWHDNRIATVEFLKPISLSAYRFVAVLPIDVRDHESPDVGERSERAIDRALERATELFARGAQRDLRADLIVAATNDPPLDESTLALRTRLLRIDTGRRPDPNYRHAYATRTEVSGELVDLTTGEVLLRFRDVKRTAWPPRGDEDDYQMLLNDFETMGRSFASLLDAFDR